MRSAPYRQAATLKAPQGIEFLSHILGKSFPELINAYAKAMNENNMNLNELSSRKDNKVRVNRKLDPLVILAQLDEVQFEAVFREYNWGRGRQHSLPFEALQVLRMDLVELARMRGLAESEALSVREEELVAFSAPGSVQNGISFVELQRLVAIGSNGCDK